MRIILLLLMLSCHQAPDTSHLEPPLLHLGAKIPLIGVSGRIDHLTFDSATRRVFVAALGNNTVEVVDLAKQSRIHSITGLHEPQGLAFFPTLNRLAAANGGDGAVLFYDGKTLALLGRLNLSGDADNIRFDGARLYVGYGSGGIATIDPATMQITGDIPLKGHPESFQLDDSDRLYINVPDENGIVLANAHTRNTTAEWNNRGASANFPMALDRKGGRLFVAYRHPAQLRTVDARTGSVLASIPCVADADDVFYDAASRLVWVTGGEGFLDGFRDGVLVNHIATRKGARTGLWLPQEKKFVLAVPARGGEPAALWVYDLRYGVVG